MKFKVKNLIILVVSLSVVSSLDVLSLANKCVTDSQCKSEEFCDHTGLNPVGSCRHGYPNDAKCHFDRHCSSKQCENFKCAAKKLTRDGPCDKDQHSQCLPEQYCREIGKLSYYCRDRKCSGFCFFFKNHLCLSNKCNFFWCSTVIPEATQTSLSEGFCSKK